MTLRRLYNALSAAVCFLNNADNHRLATLSLPSSAPPPVNDLRNFNFSQHLFLLKLSQMKLISINTTVHV
jgi:hypothetical protein